MDKFEQKPYKPSDADENQIEWNVYPKDKRIEIVSNLEGALKSQNTEEVRRILKDSKSTRSLLIGGQYDQLKESFSVILEKELNKNLLEASDNEIIRIIQDYEIPEQLLMELLQSAYHKKNRLEFFKLLAIILQSGKIENESIIIMAKHDLASWESSVQGNRAEAHRINDELLEEVIRKGSLTEVSKILFGLTFNKNLKPKNKINDYYELRENLGKLKNDGYLVNRIKLEEAREYLNLADRQKGGGSNRLERVENLQRAVEIAGSALDELAEKEITYSLLRNVAIEVLKTAKVYLKRELRKQK